MAKPRKSQDEKDLEKLAKAILSTPHKPREESKVGKSKPEPKEKASVKTKKRA